MFLATFRPPKGVSFSEDLTGIGPGPRTRAKLRRRMNTRTEARWARLVALLEPIHREAVATARRLCRSPAEGDDLYQEAVLRAFEKLHTLRDESRFRSWFYATLLSRHRSRHRATFWRRLIPLKDAFPDGREPVGEDGARWSEDAWRASRAAQA